MKHDRGQILPLFAIVLTAIIGMMALAIDVSSAYSARQAYRTIADAASLAGAQDLQVGTSRVVGATEYSKARADAIASVEKQTASTATCVTAANQANCTLAGQPFTFFVRSPLNSAGDCASCDYKRSVFVNFDNPRFAVSFARIFGVGQWHVGVGSVAGLQFAPNYAVVTLRPFAPPNNRAGTDPNDDDISLSGGSATQPTTVRVINGDIGTNTYVVTGSNTRVQLVDQSGNLTPDYRIYHYDQVGTCSNPTTTCDTWNKDATNSYPIGWRTTQLINDPQYTLPAEPTTPTWNETTGLRGISSATFTCPGAPAVGQPDALPDGTRCYKPGVYPNALTLTGSIPGAYFETGVYFFNGGFKVGSGMKVWGGLQSNQPGVSIVVPESGNNGFDAASADGVFLNSGGVGCLSLSCRASPALDYLGNPAATPGGVPLTLIVRRDPTCFLGAVPRLCADNQNNALKLAGNAGIVVGGVIYAPSDRVNVHSDATTQVGSLGQLIAWTVNYTGHATLNQEAEQSLEGGTLRLDAACTTPGTPCNP
jgi:hypothetical protein